MDGEETPIGLNCSEWIDSELLKISAKDRFRYLKVPLGKDLSSNDYLGLKDNQILKDKLIEGINIFGCGSGASRLIRGHRDCFEKAEQAFADWVGGEDALFVANGFVANLGLMDVLGSRPFKFYCDRLNHASILDGIRISGAEVRYYKHRNYGDLENLIIKENSSIPKLIVSETVFSMDGDLADISTLLRLKKKYDAVLVLDEAHALGVFGNKGGGLSLVGAEINPKEIDFRVFTCGKSLGLEGAFIVCSSRAKEYLINSMRPFIFSTAPMPAVAHAVPTAIELIQKMDAEREGILRYAGILRDGLKSLSFDTLESKSQIVPIVLENERDTMNTASLLQSQGLDIRGIRPPTVKKSRLRISINASFGQDELDKTLNILSDVRTKAQFL
jgi:8-amino-7-oxononanoate synthase